MVIALIGVILDGKITFSDHVPYNNLQRALGSLRGLYRFQYVLPENAKSPGLP